MFTHNLWCCINKRRAIKKKIMIQKYILYKYKCLGRLRVSWKTFVLYPWTCWSTETIDNINGNRSCNILPRDKTCCRHTFRMPQSVCPQKQNKSYVNIRNIDLLLLNYHHKYLSQNKVKKITRIHPNVNMQSCWIWVHIFNSLWRITIHWSSLLHLCLYWFVIAIHVPFIALEFNMHLHCVILRSQSICENSLKYTLMPHIYQRLQSISSVCSGEF